MSNHKFSYFKCPIKNTEPFANISLVMLKELTEGIFFKKQVETLRAIKDPKAARAYKASNFDYITVSGTFQKRDAASLITHSKLICIDIDNVDVDAARAKLIVDPETVMVFVSPGGNGLKWLVQIDPEQDTQANFYSEYSNYLLSEYGLKADRSGKDVARACFGSYDPSVYLNPSFS